MISELKDQLAHVLWMGGATDTGKSTIAQNLAARHETYVYHYDKSDAEHHIKLAETVPEIQKFIAASLDERWVIPEPRALFERSLFSFFHRFSLVIEDLLGLPNDKPIIAEGFGLLPEFVHPMLSSHHQAIWLVPTESFKRDSMERRGKPSFGKLTSNPEKTKTNLFTRDMMLADYYRKQVLSYGFVLYEIDGSRSAEQMTDLVEAHFAKYLARLAS
jgi:2-phosphoglycerate kinase